MRSKITKLAGLLITAALFATLMAPTAAAYIDPATTSYIIQITAAFFITLGVFFAAFTMRARLLYTKIKMKLMEEFYSRRAQSRDAEDAPASGSVTALFYDKRPYFSRLLMAAVSAFAFCFTFIVFGSLDLFVSNKNVLPFVFADIVGPIFLTGLMAFLGMTLILSLFKGKVFNWFISLTTGLLLTAYIQGNFLNMDFGQLTGDKIPWQNMTRHMLLNTFAWLLLSSLPFIIGYFSSLLWKGFSFILPILLILVQLVSLSVGIASTGALKEKKSDLYLSRAGMYEVSTKENIIVLILDRLDEMYINDIVKHDPAYFDDLDGFTRYTNNINAYCRTYPSVVNMLTGFITLYEEPAADFMARAYEEGSLLKDLRRENYSTKLYIEDRYSFSGADQIKGLADNVIPGRVTLDKKLAVSKFLRLSAFKYAPHTMKAGFWINTAEFSDLIKDEREIPVFKTDDHLYFKNLKEDRLSTQSEKNNFIFIHLNGSHAPFNMNEHGQKVETKETSVRQQTMGSFTIVREFLNQLKDMGLYEDANIIITGDHGKSTDIRKLDRPILTGLFVKRKGESGPLKISKAPVDSDNFRGSLIKMAGIDSNEYAQAYWEVDPKEKNTRKYYYRVDIRKGERRSYLEEFKVVGDANDFSNWHKLREIPMKYPHA